MKNNKTHKRNIKIKEMKVELGGIDFGCPHCGERYRDRDEIYYKKINKSKVGIAIIKCAFCGNHFKIAISIHGGIESFY
jgi:transcription elongation factor Elf1